VFELNAHEEKVNLPDNGVREMICATAIFKFNVEAIFDTNLHFDWFPGWRNVLCRVLDPEGIILHNALTQTTNNGDSEGVLQSYLHSFVRLVLHFHRAEFKGEDLLRMEFSWGCKIAHCSKGKVWEEMNSKQTNF